MTTPTVHFLHGLETPHPFRPCQNYFRLEGWAFQPDTAQASQVRIRIGQKIFQPERLIDRPDVAADFPGQSQALKSGFEFVVFLPFGNHLGWLEASADDGDSWELIRRMMIPVSSHPLMGGFEAFGENGLVSKPTRLAGWVWHPEFKLEESVLLMGNTAVPLITRLERPDVALRFPDQPDARWAGFMTEENLPRGSGAIRLQVQTENGRTYFLESGVAANITQGAYAKPRPAPEMWEPMLPATTRTVLEPATTACGPCNVLFVLYGDFTSNSAFHVTALANELARMGYDCVVVVPEHPETIGAQPDARFLVAEYADGRRISTFFRDNRGPSLIHAWTTRESVRKFCEEVQTVFAANLVVHLEDNETVLLAHHLQCTIEEVKQLSASTCDERVPHHLSHPMRSQRFLESADGVTTIIDTLTEFVPQNTPARVIWPAASAAFQPRPRNDRLRNKLGIGQRETVIFYHGNVHESNLAEMVELYRAVDQLNATGHVTWLVRAGRDSPAFGRAIAAMTHLRLLNLGFVKRAKDLPFLMSMADYFVQPGRPGDFNDYRFPSKLPEFFALGRPVIMPQTNLAKELTHLQNAYILEDANASDIAAAVRHLNDDADLVRQLAHGAAEFSRTRFSWERSARQLAEFYLVSTQLKCPSDRQRKAAQLLWPSAALDPNPDPYHRA